MLHRAIYLQLNLATCLATPLRRMLEGKLHHVTLAFKLTFFNSLRQVLSTELKWFWGECPFERCKNIVYRIASSNNQICKTQLNQFMQSLQSSTLWNCCKLQKVANQLQRWHATCCNLPATFFTTPFQHKLQRNLHRVTLAAELGSTFRNDCQDFYNHCQLQPEIATCNMSPSTYNGYFSNVAKKIASRDTSLKPRNRLFKLVMKKGLALESPLSVPDLLLKNLKKELGPRTKSVSLNLSFSELSFHKILWILSCNC